MKAKSITLIVILIILGISILGLVYITSNKKYKDTSANIDDIKSNTTVLRAEIFEGKIDSTYKTKGKVLSNDPDKYIYTISVPVSKNDSFQLNKKLGDELKKGDILYSLNGKSYKVESDMKIVEYSEATEEKVINLLDYSKLHIVTEIEYDKVNLIGYDSEIKLSLEKQELAEESSFAGSVYRIGYEVKENGKVDLLIKPDNKLMPGLEVNIEVKLKSKDLSLYTLKQMIKKEGDKYYCEIETEDGKRQRRDIVIGESFTAYNDGVPVDYVEILKGVKAGEIAITDVLID